LDQHLQPVPMGVRGEIYIGGSGLARGYRHRPDLTDKAFIHSPFGRLYKTGDLARYLDPTKIEFLGRIDHQVKIRGFRIELAEIEAVLNQHPSVQKAIAIALENPSGDKYLGAFIVPTIIPADPKSQIQLRSFLKQKLPDYMIPTILIELAEFPLTPNGKIDRLALACLSHPQLDVSFVAPRHPNEEILAQIWVEVLKLETVSIDSNFFELGGHSLLAMQVISRIGAVYGLEVPLRYLFEHPTIEQLSDRLNLILWNQSPLNQDDDLEQGEI
jgi:acyl carrier protein